MKLKRVPVSEYVIVSMLNISGNISAEEQHKRVLAELQNPSDPSVSVLENPIPDDAKIVRVVDDPVRLLSWMIIESETFPDIAEGAIIPELITVYRKQPITEQISEALSEMVEREEEDEILRRAMLDGPKDADPA